MPARVIHMTLFSIFEGLPRAQIYLQTSQETFTCSKLTKKKTLEKEVKYLKVNNKDTRKMSMTLTYLTPFSSV